MAFHIQHDCIKRGIITIRIHNDYIFSKRIFSLENRKNLNKVGGIVEQEETAE